MDEVLMLFGVTGFCPDCGDERLLVPADEDGFEHCCTDCDGAVLLLQLASPPVRSEHRRAS
jgi:hypothetical protein